MRCAYDIANAQLARLLGVAERTVKADWTFARAWLYARLSNAGHAP
jgi:DNA-binding CsgD family transcriptional regulator